MINVIFGIARHSPDCDEEVILTFANCKLAFAVADELNSFKHSLEFKETFASDGGLSSASVEYVFNRFSKKFPSVANSWDIPVHHLDNHFEVVNLPHFAGEEL